MLHDHAAYIGVVGVFLLCAAVIYVAAMTRTAHEQVGCERLGPAGRLHRHFCRCRSRYGDRHVTALATFRLRSYSITSLPPPMQQPRLGPELEANSVAAIG